MRVYLDNCCFNRPYDDQTQIKVALETQAKLHIQNLVANQKLQLVWSYMLDYENAQNQDMSKKNAISRWKKLAIYDVSENAVIISTAQDVAKTGVKVFDSLHVACAIYSKCDYFLTVDRRILKYQTKQIAICNPIDFIMLNGDEQK